MGRCGNRGTNALSIPTPRIALTRILVNLRAAYVRRIDYLFRATDNPSGRAQAEAALKNARVA